MLGRGDLPLFRTILSRFKGKSILVIGDIMVDQYIWGKVNRISPEAPVPVVWVNTESIRLGGASNVANNIYELGGHVYIAGVVGDDEMGKTVTKLLRDRGVEVQGIVVNPNAKTTLKTRIIAHNQQVVRVDREDVQELSGNPMDQMLTWIKQNLPAMDGVIISDYAKGVVSRTLAQEVISYCKEHDKVCAVDPKVPHIMYYQGCTVLTPNHHEAGQATGIPILTMEDMKHAGGKLLESLKADAVLVTFGEKGMVLFNEENVMTHIDTVARAVYDVTGAGDTVISTLTMALACDATMINAAILSNFAAGVVVGKIGTATVQVREIIRALTSFVMEMM